MTQTVATVRQTMAPRGRPRAASSVAASTRARLGISLRRHLFDVVSACVGRQPSEDVSGLVLRIGARRDHLTSTKHTTRHSRSAGTSWNRGSRERAFLDGGPTSIAESLHHLMRSWSLRIGMTMYRNIIGLDLFAKVAAFVSWTEYWSSKSFASLRRGFMARTRLTQPRAPNRPQDAESV